MNHTIRDCLLESAVKVGDFTLASGRRSKYYVDSKEILYRPDALRVVAAVILEVAADLDFAAVGGPETGAIPIAVATVLASRRSLRAFYVRKQAKTHGNQSRLVGPVGPGDRVLVVEDVVTTGQSVLDAVAVVEAAGAKVVRIVSLLDRQDGAADLLAGYDYRPIVSAADLGIDFRAMPD